MELLCYGILLGMGAAIPIGPVNLEIIRRNIHYGTPYGIVTGLGACSADVTYLVLLCAGALTLLQYPDVLRGIGLVGSLVLAYFAFKAFRFKPIDKVITSKSPSLLRYGFEGYVITLINPYTILFWASISSQVSVVALSNKNAMMLTGCGIVLGATGWVIILNTIVHFTRHRLNQTAIRWINFVGGVILLSFAVMGTIRSLSPIPPH